MAGGAGDGLCRGELAHARLADDVAANGRQCRAAPLSGTALFGYLRLRRLAVRHSVGSGDTLFLLAVAPLFAPTEFLWFLIAACVVALLWWVCCGRRRRTIPFVGAAGIVLIGWAALQFLRLWL